MQFSVRISSKDWLILSKRAISLHAKTVSNQTSGNKWICGLYLKTIYSISVLAARVNVLLQLLEKEPPYPIARLCSFWMIMQPHLLPRISIGTIGVVREHMCLLLSSTMIELGSNIKYCSMRGKACTNYPWKKKLSFYLTQYHKVVNSGNTYLMRVVSIDYW